MRVGGGGTRKQKRTCTWALVLASASARAEDTAELESLLSESVITTASTTAERASTAPATSVTITAEEMRTYGIRTLAEAIDFLSLGVVTSNPLRTPDIGSRGVLLANDDGKHFLLLVNGHAVNDPLYGAARFDEGAGIPFDLIDHVEVIVGPGSVLYGSNAMMGVINVITKTGVQYRGGHVHADHQIQSSMRAGAGAGFTFELFDVPGELAVAAEYYRRYGPDLELDEQIFPILSIGQVPVRYDFRRGGGDDRSWGGTVRDAYFSEAPSGMLRLRLGDFEIGLLASAYRRGIPYSTESAYTHFDDTETWELDRAARLDVKHQATVSSLVQITSRIYADGFDYQRRVTAPAFLACYTGEFDTCQYRDVGVARWVGVEERLSLNWVGDLSFVTLLGVDLRHRWVRTKQDYFDFVADEPAGPTAGRIDDQGSLVSPYLQQTWSPAPFMDLNAGARIDIEDRFSPVVSPRGALALHPFEGNTLRVIYSEAFRAPTWSETDLANYRVAPSEDLQPETVRSVEGSIEQRFGTHRVLFGAFRTWWHDLVAAEALSDASILRLQTTGVLPAFSQGVTQFRNVATIENYGLNAGLAGAFGAFHYGTNVTSTYTRREVSGNAQPLTVAPQLFGNARMAYLLGGALPTPALAASFLGPRFADRPLVDGERIPYASPELELRLTLSGAVPVLAGLGYRVTGAYRTPAEGAYVAGPNSAYTRFPGFTAPPRGFAPNEEMKLFVGLSYDLLGGTETAKTGGAE